MGRVGGAGEMLSLAQILWMLGKLSEIETSDDCHKFGQACTCSEWSVFPQ